MQQRLAVVTVGFESGALKDVRDLLPQQGNGTRRSRIGDRGEQAEEQALAGDLALGVEALDRDRIHVHRPVHGRAPIGLRAAQEFGLLQEILNVGRQGAEIAQTIEHRDALIAQHAQAAFRQNLGERRRAFALEGILPIAEKREMVVVHPFQECDALGNLLRRQRRR